MMMATPKEERDQKAQIEDYKRKFRNLETDRKAYAEESVAIIKKQQGIIMRLKSENNQLKETVAQKGQNVIAYQQEQQRQAVSGQGIEEIKDQIGSLNEEQSKLKQYIADFQRKLIEQRKESGGYYGQRDQANTSARKLKILENRLDKAKQKYNESVALNRDLSKKIEQLRRDRVVFDNLYKKLEAELHEKRKEMANIIETANQAYEERDRANDQIQNLKQQSKKETVDFEKDLKDLSQIMEKNRKAMEFMKLAQKDKKDRPSIAIRPAEKSLYKERIQNQALQNKVQKYEEDFAKIQAATKVVEFDTLIDIFRKNEEDVFQYVNDLSSEIEDLEKQNRLLEAEIVAFTGPAQEQSEASKAILKKLEEQLHKEESKNEEFKYKRQNLMKLLQSLIPWIENLFDTVECDRGRVRDMAGGQGTTIGNMTVLLGFIEERCNNILQTYATIVAERDNDNYYQALKNAQNLANILSVSQQERPELPDLSAEYEPSNDNVENERMLSTQELRQKAIAKLEIKDIEAGKVRKQQRLKKKY